VLPSVQKLALDLLATVIRLHTSCFLGSRWVWTRPIKNSCAACVFSSELLSNNRQGLVALSPKFSQIWRALVVGSIAKSHQATYTTPNNRTLKPTHPPTAWNVVCWLSRCAATTITYHCIALLQLLYRWQHLPQKLLIAVVKFNLQGATLRSLLKEAQSVCFLACLVLRHGRWASIVPPTHAAISTDWTTL
jgi:hypothetical protein